jgi:hypothetical protein
LNYRCVGNFHKAITQFYEFVYTTAEIWIFRQRQGLNYRLHFDNGESSTEAENEPTNNEETATETPNPQNQFLSQNGVFFQQFGENSKQIFGDIENLTIN